MSKERKSFLLHFDSLGILDQLNDDQCGKLFKACRDFNLGKELNLDDTLALVFFPFKAQFLRDQEKYQVVVERNKNNGSKGGRPPNPVKPKKPSGLIDNPSKPKEADSVNGSDNDNESVNEVIGYLNLVINAKYKTSTKSHIENISARLNDGHSVNDLKLVIDSKSLEWLNDKTMAQYLRPSTLFQASKFQGYLLAAKPTRSTNSPRAFSQ